ncbi:hypothetical protein [Ruminiclostridium hungatei]|nr:hypothetical protein [Ruminiclostridium hungatei]
MEEITANGKGRITWDAKTTAIYLGISYGLLLKLVRQKKIPFVSVGRIIP